jgi:Rod binding domain-containing protein
MVEALPVSPAGISAATSAAQRPAASMSPDQLREAARDFEAFYLARALEPMFEGLSSEAPFGGGMAEDMWRSLLIDEYGKAIAKAGGIGIADAVVRVLIDLQEQAGAAPIAERRPATAATTAVERKTP